MLRSRLFLIETERIDLIARPIQPVNEKMETQNVKNVTLCVWCGIPLGSANIVRQSVCVRCYELLINADLSDEEIFGIRRDRNKDNSFSLNN